jgi:hypothetical protein
MTEGKRMSKDKIAEIDHETFVAAVTELATRDGVGVVLSIPGVWEAVSEYYNNDAIDNILADAEEETG